MPINADYEIVTEERPRDVRGMRWSLTAAGLGLMAALAGLLWAARHLLH